MTLSSPTFRQLVSITLIAGLAACGSPDNTDGADAGQASVADAPAGDGALSAEEAAAQASALFADWFEESLKQNPILATSIGDARYNDQFPNFIGPAYRQRAEELDRQYLERIRAIDREALTGQDRLSYDIFVRDRLESLAGNEFPAYLLPINQFSSIPNFFAQLGSGQSLQPFATANDFDNFLGRIDGFVVYVDQAIRNMREGLERGYVQPRALMTKTIPQLATHVVASPEESLFWQPVANMPEEIDAPERERIETAYRAAIADKVVPAYQRLHDFIRDVYLPASRDEVGMAALPDGANWYAYQARVNTTTDLPPDEIHAIGLAEVERILGEMDTVRRTVGFEGDLPAFFEHLKADDRYYFENEEAVIEGYEEVGKRIDAVLPAFFDIFPKSNYEIRPVEAFRAESSAGASYMAGSPDGSRPGVFYINTHNLKAQPRFLLETLSLHEASPGHHFQISIQQEIEGLPMFRRFGGYTAYSEGWALYVESIGREMGLFTDPYQYYGRLSDEQLRAMRLVVDTGLHHLGWSREQAIEFMLTNSSMAESDVVAEVERYIAIPGQALAYKIGQRAITEMRRRSEAKQGEAFDIRAFHRQVLIDGGLPMDVLSAKIDEWLEAS
ncbi:MAG: DUF885 domain-containing protein [Pseudomonadota bacterium]